MTKYLFDTLVRLFAIAVNRNPNSDNSEVRALFEKFLKDYLDPKYVASFLLLFDNYINEYSSQISEKKLSLNSVKLIKYCEETATFLSPQEKSILLFHLIRLLYSSSGLVNSFEFVYLIGDLYGIDLSDIDNLICFFNGEKAKDIGQFDVFQNEKLDYIHFCNKVYAVRNNTDKEFTIDTAPFLPESVCFALKSSVINYKNQLKLYFNDLIAGIDTVSDVGFSICTQNVSLIKGKRKILNNVNLQISSGEFVGIIGKSGAGKSSLLRVLAHDDQHFSGQLLVKKEGDRDLNFSYLKQSYSFIPFFSVREHLLQRLDFLQEKRIDKHERLLNVAYAVGLEHDLDKIVVKNRSDSGQLSGGQKKRLRIAMELLANPDVFLLDEPTSGLASIDSFKILSILKTIASKGKLVVATVHQPDYDSLNLFDRIIIVDDGGYVLYSGNPVSAVEYLRNETESVDRLSIFEETKNPSLLLDLVQRGKDNNSSDFWHNKLPLAHTDSNVLDCLGKPYIINRKNKSNFAKSIISQIAFSFKTDLRNTSRLIFLLAIPLLSGILFAFIAKYSPNDSYSVFDNPNIPVWILMIVITAIFTGLVSAGNEFIFMRDFHESEHYLINKNFSLVFAKLSKYFVLSILQTLFLLLPSIFILKMEFLFIQLFAFSALLTFWGAAFGLFLSKISKSINVVYLTIPLIIVVNMIFSGVMIKFDRFNPKICNNPVPYISIFVPAYHGINSIVTEFYLQEDKKQELMEEKILLYESAYYLDFFIPAVQEIAINDTCRAIEIINSEQNKNFFMPKSNGHSLTTQLLILKDYYKRQYEVSMKHLSNNINKERYRNVGIKMIVETYYADPIIIKANEIERRFMSAYMPPYYNQKQIIFFSAYSIVFGNAISNFWFGGFCLVMMIFIVSFLVFCFKKPII
ncbi:MAG: ATP-binding cassette domain-containing protein [Bacteroidales bacterium]|nr:ATP-binding cassette domain-containing protein [Bacteroidales bacterium]